MGLKLGNFNIAKAFIGSTNVAKIYLGSTLVFPINSTCKIIFKEGNTTVGNNLIRRNKSFKEVYGHLPFYIKEGYLFEGLFQDTSFTIPFTVDTKVTKDITLYIKYTAVSSNQSVITWYYNEYTLNGNLGILTAVQKGTMYKNIPTPSQLPTPSGEDSFKGWYTDRYYGSSLARRVSTSTLTVEKDTSFYAYWGKIGEILSIDVTPKTLSLSVGDSGRLSATEESNGTVYVEDTYLTWKSSNPSVVSVNNEINRYDCTVKGLTVGSSVITASSVNGKTDLCVVTVKEKNKDGFIVVEEPYIYMSETNFSCEGGYQSLSIPNTGHGKIVYRTYNEDNINYTDTEVTYGVSENFIVRGGTFTLVVNSRYGYTGISCSANEDSNIKYGTVLLEVTVEYEGKIFTCKSNIINLQLEGYVPKTTYYATYWDITTPNDPKEITTLDSITTSESSYSYTRKEFSGYTYKGYYYGSSIETCKNATTVDSTSITCSNLSPTYPCVAFFYTKNPTSIPVTSISVSPTSKTLTVGNTTTLTATYSPSNANSGTGITWSSNNASVANVSSSGVVSAYYAGTATITATSSNGKTATCTITVNANQAVTYTVSFNANGGSGTMSNMTCAQGGSITLPSCSFTYSGKTFIGWSTSSSGGSTFYSVGSTYTPTKANTTLYAVWQTAQVTNYNITYYNNYSSTDSSIYTTVTSSGSSSIHPSAPSRTGYVFKGWSYNDRTGASSLIGLPGATNGGISGNESWYALWEANASVTYTVSFNGNGGTGTVVSKSCTAGSSITLPSNGFIHSGYTFSGWSTSINGGTTPYSAGSTFTPTADTILYAQWVADPVTPTSYTVTWTYNGGYYGGKTYTTTSVTSGTQYKNISTPSSPSKASDSNYSYSFKGWYTSSSGGTAISSSTTTLTKNVTFYALWDQTALYIPVESITVNPPTMTMNVGSTFTPSVSYTPSNANVYKSVTWTSSSTLVATVDENTGKVTAINAGNTTIIARTPNGKTGYCSLKVTDSGSSGDSSSDSSESSGTVYTAYYCYGSGTNWTLIPTVDLGVTEEGDTATFTYENLSPAYTYNGFRYNKTLEACKNQSSFDGTETSKTMRLPSYPVIMFCYTKN